MCQSKSNEEDKTLDNLNGKTVTLGELIAGINKAIKDFKSKVYVPMYQRNYKWNRSTATKLINDLIDAYENNEKKSIALFTLYIDAENNIQVVDGQQRMITLQLMFKALGKLDEFIPLEFERDFFLNNEKDKRVQFIKKIDEDVSASVALSDKRRFIHNYYGIENTIKEKGIDNYNKFIDVLKNNVSLLLHITRDEPVSEFLNLNCNKTQFSVCDRVRSALITYPVFNKIEDENEKNKIASMLDCSDYKKSVSVLFEEITRLLYIEDIYNTVKLGYKDPDKTNESRMNIMFCDLAENPLNGYMKCKSIDEVGNTKLLCKIAYYKKMLQELERDNENYQTHRAFRNFHHHNKVKFFKLIDNYIDKQDKLHLYDILHMEHSIDKHILDYTQQKLAGKDTYFVNSYFEVLSKTSKPEKEEYSSLLENQFKNNNVNKSKYFSLDKDTFEDIVQGSGKYILYRYINERHKENENMISFPTVISFDKEKKDESDNTEDNNENDNNGSLPEITMGNLLNQNNEIIIPVIQRDYCMGSHLKAEDKSNMLDYIIDNCDDNKDITLSAITVFYSKKNQINIYDGQQRIVTLACLLKILGYDQTPKITFEHRDEFNKSIQKFFESGEINEDSYAAKSIANLKEVFNDKLKVHGINDEKKKKLKDDILEKVKFDVITVSGELSTAEQFFTEINDGVQLVPYEIFKCKINARLEKQITCDKESNESFYKQWVSDMDNKWLDYFYNLNDTKIENEEAVEELMEMRVIEFCSRMIYWEKYLNEKLEHKSEKHPLKLKSFEKSGNELGDMDVFINELNIEDFKRISEIMNRLVQFEKNSEGVSCIEKDCGNDGETGFSHYNPDKYNDKDGKNYLINKFLYSLKCDNLDYHDVIIWGVLNGYDSTIIKDLMNCWDNKKINKNSFAVLYPNFIGVWYHICLLIPSYYIDGLDDRIKTALESELIDDMETEYDKVMKHLCLKSDNNTPIVQWGNPSKRYAKKWSDLVNISATDVFYYRTGSPEPEKLENKKVVKCHGDFNDVVLADEDNEKIYGVLTTYYKNSSTFMKNVGKVTEIKQEKSNASYQMIIQTCTENDIYIGTIWIDS